MINLLPRLESEFPWLHTRSVRVEDCHEFCAAKGVEVVYQHGVPFGAYVLADGEHFIFLDPKLSGWMLLYVFCHEIGHYLFHTPTQSNRRNADIPVRRSPRVVLEFFNNERKRKNDIEAEQVAALMLLPMHEIGDLYETGAHEAFPELGKLIAVREQCERLIRQD